MGTEARITLHARDPEHAATAAAAAFDRIAQLDRSLSDYRVDSEIAAIAAAAGGQAIPVSDDLLRVLQLALDIARETGGAFDPTGGPVSLLWRDARRAATSVDPVVAQRAAELVDWRRVTIDEGARTVRLHSPGMRLDLGAIGKGYAADEALATLRHHGTPAALIVFGGEIVAGDAPPGTSGWRIAIDHAAAGEHVAIIANEAVSTSGDTEQFVEIAGERRSHVFDARTGEPLTGQPTATVVAQDGMTADALATAATVLEPAARARFIARHPSARFYVRNVPPQPESGGTAPVTGAAITHRARAPRRLRRQSQTLRRGQCARD